jgi:ribonucleotide reductase beta subunit family protein with ferritin-like domain
MYVAKLSSENLFYRATLFEKTWSEEISSNNIVELDSKRFISYFFAKYWLNKKIVSLLLENKQMEIIDG